MSSALPMRRFRLSALVLGIVVLATGVLVGGAPAQAAVTYSISGTVYLGDTSRPATTGEASVEWTRVGSSHVAADVVPVAVDGTYTISGLSDLGSYYVFFRYSGGDTFSSTFYGDDAVAVQPTHPLTIQSADLTGMDDILELAGSLTGTVSIGTVATVAAAGQVYVTWRRAYGDYTTGVNYTESARTYVDAAGRYTLNNLLPGTYRLWFTVPNGTVYLGGMVNVTVAPGSPTVFDYTVPAAGSVSGHVYLGTTNSPAGAGAVTAYLEYFDAPFWEVYYDHFAVTDASGFYHFDHVPPGLYRVGFIYHGTGYRPDLTSGTVTVGTVVHDQVIPAGNRLSGYVVVVHLAGENTSDVRVSFVSQTGTTYTVTPEPGGNFQLDGVPDGSYVVRIDYLGTDPDVFATRNYFNNTDCFDPCVLQVNRNISHIEFAITPKNTIRGRLVTGPSIGLAGATVRLREYDRWTGAFVHEFSTTTDSNGDYVFTRMNNAKYTVLFEKAGYSSQWYTEEFGGRSSLDEPELLNIYDWGSSCCGGLAPTVMYEASSIHGTVTGAGLTAAELSAGFVYADLEVWDDELDAYRATGVHATAAANGSYTLDGLYPGQYRVTLIYDGPRGLDRKSTEMSVGMGNRDLPFSATLSPLSRLVNGTLVKAPGSPIYLVDGVDRFVPVASAETATDAGLGGTVKAITNAQLLGYQDVYSFEVASNSLGNIVNCGGTTYLASQGKLWPISAGIVAGLPKSTLSSQLCAVLSKSPNTLTSPLFLRSPSPVGMFYLNNGVRQKVESRLTLLQLAGTTTVTVYSVSGAWAATVPLGESVVPGKTLFPGKSFSPGKSLSHEKSVSPQESPSPGKTVSPGESPSPEKSLSLGKSLSLETLRLLPIFRVAGRL